MSRSDLLKWVWIGLVILPLCLDTAHSQDRKPIRTFFVTRSLGHERLLPYIKTARPEVVQIGNYGAMFHGYADNPKSTGWPMQLPVAGEKEALAFQKKLNAEVHGLGLKVVGHFRLTKVMGHWKEQTGFVEYYNNRWPEELLGPKPHADLKELLQRDAAGEPIQLGRYNQSQLALCLSSPPAREMLKRMLKVAVDQGIDGVNTTFNYNFACACPHCQKAFKNWLSENLTQKEIEAKLGIRDLGGHAFSEIPARISGYPDPETARELDWLAMRFGAEHFKKMFDEIFLEYGRSLKRDLIVAQWNHLGHVSQSEERMFLPKEFYGRGEDYFWYSGGAAFVGKNLNLKQGKAGDAWLSCLYVREMTGGRPFVMGKYDRTRLAVSMAEGYATGGMGMGRYMRFEEPAGFEVLSQYTNFMHKHRGFYDGAQPIADAAIVLPRQSVINGKPESFALFREVGQALVERQVLLDVVSDENITRERIEQYPALFLPGVLSLSDVELEALKKYEAGGKPVFVTGDLGTMTETGDPRKPWRKRFGKDLNEITKEKIGDGTDGVVNILRKKGSSKIEAPWTVRAAAYKQPGRVILHLVNYDREEDAPENNRTGPETERPKPVHNIKVHLPLPKGESATSVKLITPDAEEPASLKFQDHPQGVDFSIEQFKVYALIVVETGPR